MERLTIKELAPYLPYGLKLYIWNGGYEKPIEYPTLIGLHGDSIIQSGYRFKSIHCGDEIFSRPEMSNSLSIIKPLLRPFSQLTEEINWGNQTYAITDLFEIGDEGGYIYEYDHGNIKLISQLKTIAEYNYHHDINYLPYPVVQVLIEHHFDVFGLIDRSLALPIDGKEVDNGI